MSGSFEKRSSGADRRHARAQKERLEKRKIRIITVSVVAALVLLFAGALFLNSKYIRRNITAVTIGGIKFTAVEFDYFYNVSFQEYRNMVTEQMGDYASSMLPSNQRTHSSQIYDSETGRTWADFIGDYALEQMSMLVQYYNAAQAAGYVLPDEERAAMDGEIAEFKQTAEMYSFMYPSFESMLQEFYGININESSFRKINEFVYTANAYSAHVRDSFTYSAGELRSYYQEHSDMLDIYTYRYFLVSADSISQTDYETDEEFDAAKEAASAEASERAAQILEGIETEDDFINAARQYDETAYDEPDSTLRAYPGSWLGSYYGPWMRENEREYGDKNIADMSSGTYVVFFIDRDSNDYRMTEMRQILILRDTINPEDYPEGEDDPDYIEAVENADMEARERAENAYSLFVAGGASESLLIEMMPDLSDDYTEGGFYDEISKDLSHNKMVAEIEEWLFADEREYGNSDLIVTEDYGYHIVFFMRHGEQYSDYLADKEMRDRDYASWEDSLESVEAVRRWAFILTQQ